MYFELFITNETALQEWLNFNAWLKNVEKEKKKRKETWSLTSGADDNPTNATQEYLKHLSLQARNLIRVIKRWRAIMLAVGKMLLIKENRRVGFFAASKNCTSVLNWPTVLFECFTLSCVHSSQQEPSDEKWETQSISMRCVQFWTLWHLERRCDDVFLYFVLIFCGAWETDSSKHCRVWFILRGLQFFNQLSGKSLS